MVEWFRTNLGVLYKGDILEVLKFLPDESVDLVIADPPYNSDVEWDGKDDEWQFRWLEEVKRVMKEGASLYVFFAPLKMYGVEGWIRSNLTLKNVMVWHHPNLYGAGLSYGSDRWKSTWDVVFYATKGKKAKHGKNVSQEGYKFNSNGGGFDVLIYSQPRPLLHKAQKPLELIMKLIWCSSNEGDVVLDPFLGSGTTAVACEKLERKWIGIEIEEEFCEITKQRFKKEFRQKTLFSYFLV
jgi:site-specific DNA-methyltransferase (adenine-specific)